MQYFVELREAAIGLDAAAEVDMGDDLAEIVVSSLEEDYEEIIARMHRTLAHLGQCGEMLFNLEDLDAEKRVEAERVVEKLSKRDRTIKPEDVVRVHRKAAEYHERMALRLGELGRVMGEEGLKRGLNKEERKTMTLGDVLEGQPHGEER